MKKLFSFFWFLTIALFSVHAAHQPEFSTAGFYQTKESGREVFSFNPGWRFHKGDVANAATVGFDDSNWDVVSLPNGIELLPTEASGCVNYQGVSWYRKHFTPEKSLSNKKLFLHFEAIMGKSKVFVNGKQVAEHFGGYLPFSVELTDVINPAGENVIAVWSDNSDDPAYAPGKPQHTLDFSYFGGIYRDCWLIAHNDIYITDPNAENEIAGGGLFVAFDNVSDQSADILLKTEVRNASGKRFKGVVEYELQTKAGETVALVNDVIQIGNGKKGVSSDKVKISNPKLWSPESPVLYNLFVRIRDKEGNIIDGYRRRIGIRSIEFKGEDGFWLNGKPYENPLIGANRHQDFAIIGNAVPNSLHWRDAKKLRDAGLKVIRNAHCPQDPAFMDACDELGLFVIVNTPGWQFWNEDPIFAKRVYQDIRNMVRRDRNHPSVWLWEPILNETWYPADFAKNAHDIVMAEYPYPYCYTGCDNEARGKEVFPVLFGHPAGGDKDWAMKHLDPKKSYFTREWGDNVDDWNSHNSPSRVARNWGEEPMLVQTRHYANPPYAYSSLQTLHETNRQHMGGCLWHSFDHQRGYHPDPFYGGMMDVFRQPKYSYYMFMSQREAEKSDLIADNGPMIFIAHEMTPFSGKDVSVYSNCEEVRLTVNKEGKTYHYTKPASPDGMRSPIIVFEDAFDFMTDKKMSMNHGKQSEVFLLAEGLIDGKVVATHKVAPARRPEKILLWADHEGMNPEANGSDVVTVIAAIADKNGNIKRLNNYFVKFEIEGEGTLVADDRTNSNPAPIRWGTAPVLVKTTTTPGKIRVKASVLFEGAQMPTETILELETSASTFPLIFDPQEKAVASGTKQASASTKSDSELEKEIARLKKEIVNLQLKEVERQQKEFGEQK